MKYIFKNLFPFLTYSYQTLNQDDIGEPLFPEEAKVTLNFTPKRLREFSIGRYCAREALCNAGIQDFPLLISSAGSPLWPNQYTGSIAHTKDYTAASVAHMCFAQSIGIDIEELTDFPKEIKADILRSDEIAEFYSYNLYPESIRLAIFFSIKEAVYKAYNPVYRKFLEFNDVSLRLNEAAGSYTASIYQQPVGINQEPLVIEGLFLVDSKRVYASAWIGAEK